MDVVGLVSLKDWIQIHHFLFLKQQKKEQLYFEENKTSALYIKHFLFMQHIILQSAVAYLNPVSASTASIPSP